MASGEFLSEDELKALMEGMAGGGPGDWSMGTEDFQPYDLVSAENAVAGILPLLETIHERFTYQLQAGLCELLRRDVEVSLGTVEVRGYRDFITSLSVPCSLNLISMAPLSGPGLLIFEHPLVFVVVDTFFGGKGSLYGAPCPRDFTATDNRLIRRLLELAFHALSSAWKPFLAVTCTRLGAESDPQFVTDINPDEAVVVINVQVGLDRATGHLRLALPCSMFEPVRGALLASLSREHPSKDEGLLRRMREGLKDSQVQVRCLLTETGLSLRELVALKVGDFIAVDIPARAILEAEGIPLYTGRYGVSKGWRALEIQQTLTVLDGGTPTDTKGTDR